MDVVEFGDGGRCVRPQEAGGCQIIIEPGATDGLSQFESLQFQSQLVSVGDKMPA